MARGKIKKWLTAGGKGWIIDDADGAECFFRSNDLRGLNEAALRPGLAVEFVRGNNNQGGTARDVRSATDQATGVATQQTPPPLRTPGGPRPAPAISVEAALRTIPVPAGVRALLEVVGDGELHPGLVLDRFHLPCPKQEQQGDELRKMLRAGGGRTEFAGVRKRWEEVLTMAGAVLEPRTTDAPLTLHLARASSFENAGLCLHPIHGFTYLPGTGLKGMARAYAETVWLDGETDKVKAWKEIEAVFGCGPGAVTMTTPTADEAAFDQQKSESARAGSIVFHDAWPVEWPLLLVDIVNNHHPKYYRGEDAPGDWDSPNPVYFLAVKPGTTFTFALAKRRWDVADERMKLAREWLDGALTELGCGAKTVAGYGYFVDKGEAAPLESSKRERFSATLELVTPAFLAGAEQKAEDCVLRPATLRGLLRWWWRTMHIGFVDDAELRRMEAAMWGDTRQGGAVQIRVRQTSGPPPALCPYKRPDPNKRDQLVIDREFLRRHGIPPGQARRTQGLAFAGYGMDEIVREGGQKRPKKRWYAAPGTTWTLDLVARNSKYRKYDGKGDLVVEKPLMASLVLDQAKAALKWICTLGGVGSKSRKGFGSFALPPELNTFDKQPRALRGDLREACGLPRDAQLDERLVGSASLKMMLDLSSVAIHADWLVVPTQTTDAWCVMNEIGRAYQAFTQSDPSSGHGKHCEDKQYLGLPRGIHGPPPTLQLRSVRGDRHASPALFHVSRAAGGHLCINVACFPTAELRPEGMHESQGLSESRRILGQLLQFLQKELDPTCST